MSAVLLGTGCYTGLDRFDANDDDPPEAEGDRDPDSEEDSTTPPDEDEPEESCRTAGRTAMRLLTAAEYDNTVRELLQVDLDVRSRLPADELVGGGFTHNGGAFLDTAELRQYMQIAEELADATILADLMPCEPGDDEASQRACAEQFIAQFGRRAYRRPLTELEARRWLDVYDEVRADPTVGVGFWGSVRTVTTGMLQSPFFLMLSELGELRDDTPPGLVSLTSHELASKLAYLLWDGLPDEELGALADEGALVDPEQLEAQTRRMLEDPRAREGLGTFFRQWLHTDRVLSSSTVDMSLRQSMVAETEHLIEHVMWADDADGTLDELLGADYAFVDGALAAHYGLEVDVPPGEVMRVALPDERRGLLGQGTLLAAYGERSASIHRGLRLYGDMLCQLTAPPPAELDTGAFDHLSPREAADARIDNETCTNCHGMFELPAIALERYDAAGRWRTTYENGDAVDDSGVLLGDPVQGLTGLSDALTGNEVFQRCVAQRASEYAFGRDALRHDGEARQCVSESIEDALISSGGDLRELVVGLVRSDGFRFRDPGADASTCE